MAHYELFHPDHEYRGRVIIGLENAAEGGERLRAVFERHGLTGIKPDTWYPGQPFMDVLNELASSDEGQPLDFVAIGLKSIENAYLPARYNDLSLYEILQSIDEGYRANNRGTDIGEIRGELVADGHVRMLVRAPTPDDMWYGVIYGYMRRFVPKGTYFTVSYDEEAPSRYAGGEHTIIHVTWE